MYTKSSVWSLFGNIRERANYTTFICGRDYLNLHTADRTDKRYRTHTHSTSETAKIQTSSVDSQGQRTSSDTVLWSCTTVPPGNRVKGT